MNSTAPQIGFDRFIELDWVDCVLSVRAGIASTDDLKDRLDAAALGKEARAKTRTKLNSFGLQPKPELADFIDRGQSLAQGHHPANAVLAFAWGAAIASYPFFGKVAEFIGRLTSIQGDCAVAELHRRMSEVYGGREVTVRATQAVLQSQVSWGVVERVERGKRLIRLAPTPINNDELTAWLIEAAVRYSCKSLAVSTLQSLPVLFPFMLARPLAYVISNNRNLDLRSEGPSNQLVALRESI